MIYNKLPVYIITGFLGAGKTSFINHLLAENPSLKFAIIENEVGKIGIDPILLNTQENIFEIFDGCVCCSVKNELLEVLDELIKVIHQFDILLIETTGIADTSSVIRPFYSQEYLDWFQLIETVNLLDLSRFTSQFSSVPEIQKQLVVSDTVVLNKMDCLNGDLQEIKNTILDINHSVTFFEAVNGKIEHLDFLKERVNSIEKKFLHPIKIHHHFDHDIVNHLIEKIGQLSRVKLHEWLSYFLGIYKNQIFRLKGIVYLENGEKCVLDCVGENFSIIDTEYSFLGEIPENKFVIIGRNIEIEKIRVDFDYLFSTEN